MDDKTKNYLYLKFKEYYTQLKVNVPDIQSREFGYSTDMDKKIGVRHKSYLTNNDLKTELIRQAPFYISYSNAHYDMPSARPMKNKDWLGADLVFDLDADYNQWDLEHKYEAYKTLMHPVGFEMVKRMAQKLIYDFLIPDFGFSKDEILVNFSGNRGYHVRILSKAVQQLSRDQRRGIVDFVSAKGLKFDSLFNYEMQGRIKILNGPSPNSKGWGGKIARTIIQTNDPKMLPKGARSKKNIDILKSSVKNGLWNSVKVTKDSWEETVMNNHVVNIADDADAMVTFDISKLLRMPQSLHGTSSFIVKELKLNELDDFNPLNDSVFFDKGETKVKIIEDVPELYMLNQTHSALSKGIIKTLPTSLAIFLLCKGCAVFCD